MSGRRAQTAVCRANIEIPSVHLFAGYRKVKMLQKDTSKLIK